MTELKSIPNTVLHKQSFQIDFWRKWKQIEMYHFLRNFMVQNILYLEACQIDAIHFMLRLSTNMF